MAPLFGMNYLPSRSSGPEQHPWNLCNICSREFIHTAKDFLALFTLPHSLYLFISKATMGALCPCCQARPSPSPALPQDVLCSAPAWCVSWLHWRKRKLFTRYKQLCVNHTTSCWLRVLPAQQCLLPPAQSAPLAQLQGCVAIRSCHQGLESTRLCPVS